MIPDPPLRMPASSKELGDKPKRDRTSYKYGVFGVKKGKKMPAIELDGRSEARFELRDGKIVRVEDEHESRLPAGPGRDR